jgi:hypothetical protein
MTEAEVLEMIRRSGTFTGILQVIGGLVVFAFIKEYLIPKFTKNGKNGKNGKIPIQEVKHLIGSVDCPLNDEKETTSALLWARVRNEHDRAMAPRYEAVHNRFKHLEEKVDDYHRTVLKIINGKGSK